MQVDCPMTRQTDEAVDDCHLNKICSTAVHVTGVAFLVTVNVYSLVFSWNDHWVRLQQVCPYLPEL